MIVERVRESTMIGEPTGRIEYSLRGLGKSQHVTGVKKERLR
jgi:hypothetical protein